MKTLMVVGINKFDLNEDNTRQVEACLGRRGIQVVGKIPFDTSFVKAVIAGVPFTEYSTNGSIGIIKKMWEKVSHMVRAL